MNINSSKKDLSDGLLIIDDSGELPSNNHLEHELDVFNVKRSPSSHSPPSPTRSAKFDFEDKGQNGTRHTPRKRAFSEGHNRELDGRRRERTLSMRRMRHISETFSAVSPDDENAERGNWSNQFEFFLSCLGYAVGLGNVWRFPYLCHKNGGGAFLIPYSVMLVFCGIPLLMIELSIGQYFSEGPVTIWQISPIFKGVGIAAVVICSFMATYYNVITAWGIYYLYASMSKTVPWACCNSGWVDEGCVDSYGSCPGNVTAVGFSQNETKTSSDFYFHRVVLELGASLDNVGAPVMHLVVCLLIAWLIVFLVLMKGVKTFGKAVYFTSLFPYVILLILLIRSTVEPGALDGLEYYLKPNWTRLGSPEVWGDAATQIFFSTGVAQGSIITLASYSRFKNNIYRDALVIAFGNSLTSLFSGTVVFSILGFMATNQNQRVKDVVTEGPGLTFITYPHAVTLLPTPQLWSALFFIMLVTLALSSMFPTVENVGTAIVDSFPQLRPWKFWVTLSLCVSGFFIGLAVTTQGGMYVLTLLDRYAVGYALMLGGLMESIAFAWVYGADNIMSNIYEMTGIEMWVTWKYVWKFVTPTLILFCLVFSWYGSEAPTYGIYTFPDWAVGFGWWLTTFPLVIFLLVAMYMLWKEKRDNPTETLLNNLIQLARPGKSRYRQQREIPSPPVFHPARVKLNDTYDEQSLV